MLRRTTILTTQIIAAVALAAALVSTAPAQDVIKANNATNLDQGASWVGGVAPTNINVAVWDSAVAAANAVALGADQSWAGLRIANPGGAVTINAGNVLNLLASGIDMSAATQNLTVSSGLDIGAAQVWNIGAGRTFTLNGVLSDALSTSGSVTKRGAGALTMTSASTNLGAVLLQGGTTSLVYSGAAPSDILNGAAVLSVGNSTLNMTGAAGGSNLQSVASTAFTAGLTTVNVANGAGGTMQWNAGTVTAAIGSAVRFTTLATDTGETLGVSVPVAATGAVTANSIMSHASAGASGANAIGILGAQSGGNSIGVASAGYATVGLYDFAATDGFNLTGLSQIAGGYTTAWTLGAINNDLTANTTLANGGAQRASGTVRFNTPLATTITVGTSNLFTNSAFLITPNMGANNTQVNGAASSNWQIIRNTNPNGAQQGTIWQNNTQAFFTIGVAIINGREGTGDPSSVVVNGAGTTVFSGVNSYTGTTYVNEGALMVTADNNLGGAAAPISLGGGTVVGNASFTANATRPISLRSGGGGIAATAGNLLTVDGVISNDANGGGRLTIGIPASAANGNVLGRVAGTGAGTANATDIMATGRVAFSNANTYTQGTNVVSGTLLATNTTGSATGTGAVTVGSGAGFGGTGSASGTVSALSGGHVTPGVGGVNSGIGTVSVGGLSLAGGSILDFDMSAAQNDMVSSSGGLALAGPLSVNLFQAGTTGQYNLNGTYTLFNITAGAIPSVAALNSNLTIANPVGGGAYTWGVSGNSITLLIQGLSNASNWAVNGGGLWGTAGNWSPAAVPNNAGDSATFGNALTAGTASVTLNAVRTVGNLAFNNTNGASYSIDAAGGSLTMNNGASTATIAAVNGNHSVNAPITLASDTTASVTGAANTLTISGAISGAKNLAVTGAGRVILTANNSYVNTSVAAGASLQIGAGGATGSLGSGTIALDGTLDINHNNAVSLNAITGGGTLVNSGSGTTTLAAANTGAFSTTVNAGSVVVGAGSNLGSGALTANGGSVNVNGASPTVSALAGTAGTVDNGGAGTSILTVNQAGATTFNGTLSDTGGAMQLVKDGLGTLTFGGTNAIDGGIQINAGAIVLNSSTALPAGKTLETRNGTAPAVQLGAVTVGGNIVLNPSNNSATVLVDVTAGSAAVLTGTIAPAATPLNVTQYRIDAGNDAATSLTVAGSGSISIPQSLTTVGAVAFTPIVVFERGNFVFAGSSNLTVGPDAWLGRNGGSNPTFTFRDNATFTNTGALGIILGGGGTVATASITMTIQDNAAVSTTGTLDLNGNASNVPTTVNLNGGSLTLLGFTQSSASGSVSTINFNGTQVNVANAGGFLLPSTLATTAANVSAGGAKVNTAGFDTSIDIALVHDPALGTADGGLTKSGAGLLTLNGINTYTGPTKVTGGTLSLVNAVLDDLADVHVSTGAIFDLAFGGTDTIDSLYLNGIGQAVGTWGAPGSGATFTSSLFSGGGILQVTSVGAPPIAGDFDGNGVVNGADLTVWKGAFGLSAAGDADNDGDSDGQDFLRWQRNLGMGGPAVPSSGSVPEPSMLVLSVLALPAAAALRRRRK